MHRILIPLPKRDFDPSEVSVSWKILKQLGHEILFFTPDGQPSECDEIMISGRGLDPWSRVPLIGRVRVLGLILRANGAARRAYALMKNSPEYLRPGIWGEASVDQADGLLLPGGHRARGMREYLESPILQRLVANFFERDKPVAAICHGVLLAARSTSASGRSVLFGRKTTALTWQQEQKASTFAHLGRWWDRDYYRTYTEKEGEVQGFRSVQQEVTRSLSSVDDFLDVPRSDPHFQRKTAGIARDTELDSRPAWVVRDGNYVSARWPGDAHTFAKVFHDVLSEHEASSLNRASQK